MTAARRIQLPSGRWAGVSGLGDPIARRLVIACHPLGTASGFDPDPMLTDHWGVHILSFDRPGYGASDPWREGEQPSVTAWADDIAGAVLRDLEEADRNAAQTVTNHIGILGWGGGGAYALALAARFGDRVDRLALIGTQRPRALSRLAVSEELEPEVDLVEEPLAARRLDRIVDAGATQGDAGRIGDARALVSHDWANDLRSIPAATLLVHRRDGVALGSADARWYERHLRRAASVLSNSPQPIVDHWHRLLDHLAPEHGEVPEALR
ncbi:alpha/beta fold hydrolase [Schumannella soli]|uniref:Alpha/beta fold hydrolase n=1 Tax=Schumannella soli TaxID=2590779 RepID=A0A506Y6I0_9MICO|nr:alpha/beta fold hydrolase [Schumannella soli]TPW77483.1 alpha/beta fold hydrolase [Schumannella soli]